MEREDFKRIIAFINEQQSERNKKIEVGEEEQSMDIETISGEPSEMEEEESEEPSEMEEEESEELLTLFYCRTSSENGLHQHISIDNQIENLLTILQTSRDKVQVYMDRNRSCGTLDLCKKLKERKQLIECVNGMTKKDIKICCYDISRFSRDITDFDSIVKELRKISREKELYFITPSGRYNLKSIDDVHLLRCGVSSAQLEYEKILERNNKIMEFRKKRGDTFGRAPYGYANRRDVRTGRIYRGRHPEQFLLINFILALIQYSSKYDAILIKESEFPGVEEAFTENGYTPFHGKYFRVICEREKITRKMLRRMRRFEQKTKPTFSDIAIFLNVKGFRYNNKKWVAKNIERIAKLECERAKSDLKYVLENFSADIGLTQQRR
jgi:DNA invertase Pin-like site-specific DNA recombinase